MNGRVGRASRTLQDHLAKELRRRHDEPFIQALHERWQRGVTALDVVNAGEPKLASR